jgi:hypothetical protein
MSEEHRFAELLREVRDEIRIQTQQNEKLMSAITDWAATEQASLTAISNTLNSIVTGIAALDALIQGFQNSPGTLSAADQAALNAISAQSAALVAQSAAISTAPPVAPVTPAAPVITAQPQAFTGSVAAGTTQATLTVTTSDPSPTYQWFSGTAPASAISGATSASFTTPVQTSPSTVSYYCAVTNATGTTTSSVATVTITA